MASDPVNPFCTCDPCQCTPVCTCGLQPTEETSNVRWDAAELALHHTVSTVYRPTLETLTGKAGASDHRGSDSSHGHPEPGMHTTPLADTLEQLRSGDMHANVTARNAQSTAHHGHGEHESVRVAEYKGHRIVIKTRYKVTIDDKPMTAHMVVAENGAVQYHGLPNHSDPSGIELMKRVIDNYPDDFPVDQ